MGGMESSIDKAFTEHIEGTDPEAIVVDLTLYLTNLTLATRQGCNLTVAKVHITTRVIKHLYDRKPAEEFDVVLKNLAKIVRFPDRVYLNKDSKRGTLCFFKTIGKFMYLCSIETKTTDLEDGSAEEMNYVVTCFRVRDENYLKGYELLWSWKGDIPSS